MDSDVYLGRSYALASGLRVRLRLAQSRDLAAIAELLGAGSPARELSAPFDAARLVRHDPRRRVVVCATALLGGAETVVGFGAIDVGADAPDIVCVEASVGEDLRDLLARGLRSRADVIAGRRAA